MTSAPADRVLAHVPPSNTCLDLHRLGPAPQGVLNWVGQWAPGREPEAFEARLYDVLFRSEEPGDVAGDWLADLNADSLEVVTDALATPGLAKAAVGDRCDAILDAGPRFVVQSVTATLLVAPAPAWCLHRWIEHKGLRHLFAQSPYAKYLSRM